MATFYANKGKVANLGDYHGENAVWSSYSSTATLSSGDVVVACRLPAFCKVTDVVLIPGAAAGGSGVFQVGTSASAEQFLTSATMSANLAVVASKASALGYQFSASDAATIRYEEVIVTPRSGVTAGRWFDILVRYVHLPLNE